MALDQIKVQQKPEEAAKEVAKEAATSLSTEAFNSGKTETKAADEKKPEAAAVTASMPKLELNTGADAQKNLALKSVMKEKNISAPAVPLSSSGWSVLDTVASVAKKAADIITSSTVLGYLTPVVGIGAGITLGAELVKVADNMYQSKDKKLTVSKVGFREGKELRDDWDKMFNSDAPSNISIAQGTGKGAVDVADIKASIQQPKADDTANRVSFKVDDTSTLNKDMMGWLFEDKEKPQGVAVSDNLFNYTDANKERTEVTTAPDRVHIEKTDAQGNVRTIVDKSTNRTMVLHDKESVLIENGKQVVKGDGYKITWDEQGKRHITMDNGNEVVRDGDSVKIIIGGDQINVGKHQLDVVGPGISFVDSTVNLAARTEQIRKTLQEGQTYLLAIKGVGTRTIFQDGTTFDVQRDKARLETKTGEVVRFEIKDGKLFVNQNGELLALDSEKSPVKVVDGKFKIGDLVIDQKELSVKMGDDEHCDRPRRNPDCHNKDGGSDKNPAAKTDGSNQAPAAEPGVCTLPPGGDRPNPFVKFDLRTGEFNYIGNDGSFWRGEIAPDGSTKVTDGNKTFENNATDSKVKITTAPGGNSNPAASTTTTTDVQPAKQPEVMTVDLSDTKIEAPKFVDEPKQTVIKGTDTVIKDNRTVEFKDGPTVNPDGSVKVDKNTWVSKDLHVVSHGWESSAASNPRVSITEANAQNVAISIAQKASSVQNLAKSGVVRWTEVASLNSALGDVLSMMASVPAGSPAHAALMRSYSILVQAISVATPKAQATERAMNAGVDSKLAVKAVEQGYNLADIKKHRAA